VANPDVEITMDLIGRLGVEVDDEPRVPRARAVSLLAALDAHDFDLWSATRAWFDGDPD
jgi:hypothetical protein